MAAYSVEKWLHFHIEEWVHFPSKTGCLFMLKNGFNSTLNLRLRGQLQAPADKVPAKTINHFSSFSHHFSSEDHQLDQFR